VNSRITIPIIIVVFSVMTFSMIPFQQQILENAFAQDDESDTDIEQRLRQKNLGSGESTNFNCVDNTLEGSLSSMSSCRIREPARPPPEEGTLLVEKICAVIPCLATFSIQITGNNPQPPNFVLGPGGSQLVTLGPGHFRIVEGEIGPAPFTTTFSGDCEQTSPGSDEATGTIDPGDELTCTITNTFP
jgi:hypothetical protein